MRRVIASASNKPSIAKSAVKLISEFDVFFELLEYQEDADGIISQDDMDTLNAAYDILMFADKAFTTNYRLNNGYDM